MFKKAFSFMRKPLGTTMSVVVNPHKTTRLAANFIANFLVKFLCCAFALVTVLIVIRDGLSRFVPAFKKSIKVVIYSENGDFVENIFSDFSNKSFKIDYKIVKSKEGFISISEKNDVSIVLAKDIELFEKNNILFPIKKNGVFLRNLEKNLAFNGVFGNYISLCRVVKYSKDGIRNEEQCVGDECNFVIKNPPLNSILIGQSGLAKEGELRVVTSHIANFCKSNNYV